MQMGVLKDMDPIKKMALQRTQKLFCLAQEVVYDDSQLAQRYVEIARKIAMKVRLRLPREYKRMICKHCKNFILPGENSRVRIQSRREPHVVITCFNCGGHMRIPLGN